MTRPNLTKPIVASLAGIPGHLCGQGVRALSVALLGVALAGLVFPPQLFAGPLSDISNVKTYDREALLKHLAEAPDFFWIEAPSIGRQILFTKAGGGFFYSDPEDDSMFGFIDFADFEGLAKFSVDKEEGRARGVIPMKDGDGNLSDTEFEITENWQGGFTVDLGSGIEKAQRTFDLHVPDIGWGNEKAVVEIIITISLSTAVLVIVGCAGMLAACYTGCWLVCPEDHEFVDVHATYCGLGECDCRCEGPEEI